MTNLELRTMRETQSTQQTHPFVSVVIPTLNSGETLEKCLTSIKANNTKYRYEVIVVDAGSNDETVKVAQKYANKVLDGMPARINRNKGVEAARGEIICFTDSDCSVPNDWIDRLADGLLRLNVKDNKIVGVGGGNVPTFNNPTLEELAVSKTMRSPLVAFKARNTAVYKDEREVPHNPPLNSALFKRAIEEVGGFEEELGYGYGEDLALDAKLVEKGYKLYYLPDLLVWHKHPSTSRKFAKQMYAYGWGRVKLGKKHGKYFQFHHYGPIFLCIMTFSPLFFIPLGMALANATYVSFGERNRRLFPPLVRLTMSFYVNYGRGEILALRGKEL
jgi:glycosyltransferase involved in cell wall biosynthesis